MPRPAKGPQLYLRDRKGAEAIWYIRDGKKLISTGCGIGDREGAERELERHLAQKHTPARGERRLCDIPVEDVISIYARDEIPKQSNKKAALGRAERLIEWWTGKTLADVNGHNCRGYADSRPSPGGARRDLQDLAAAISHHHEEGYHREEVKVPLPPAGKRRERWLTRNEIAKLVWAAWTMREQMRRSHSDKTADRLPTRKRTGKHIARAIIMAYYTASRTGDVLNASFHAAARRSYIDIDSALFFRLPPDKIETDKRQPPVKIGRRLLSHLKRWRDTGQCASFVVEWEGKPVSSIKTGFGSAVDSAKLGDGVTPYTLRHSRITHQVKAGISLWEVAAAAGTSEAMIRKHYGHWAPDHLDDAVNAR